MLKDTLVIWGGELGRTPYCQGRLTATEYGETDEFGYNVVRDAVHIHDLQATVLHCCGIDHQRLTYKFQGRDYGLPMWRAGLCD
jgi:hypothetical protein